MCRPSKNGQPGRRCKKLSHMSPEKKEEYNARRRELYKENKELKENYELATLRLQLMDVRTVSPENMETTMWYTTQKTEFNKAHQNPHDVLPLKPSNAMWTAPSTGDGKSAWTDYNYYEMGARDKGHLTEVRPSKYAVVVQVSSEKDLQALYNAYPSHYGSSSFPMACLDYEKMRKDGVQAVHVTEHPNGWSVRTKDQNENFSHAFGKEQRILYGWDLPSTAWLDKRVVKIGKRHASFEYPDNQDDYYDDRWEDEEW